MIEYAALFAMGCFGLGLLMCLWRMLIGPTLGDRMLALDTMALSVIALIALFGILHGTDIFFEVSMLIAMTGFISTVAFAKFLQRSDLVE